MNKSQNETKCNDGTLLPTHYIPPPTSYFLSYDHTHQSLAHYPLCSRHARRRAVDATNSITYTSRTSSGSGRCRDPFSERLSLAESFAIAAERLERGDDRFLVDEYIRTSIAVQPTSGQWGHTIDKILQTAASPNTVVYANNLRQIVKGLKRDGRQQKKGLLT